MRIVYLLYIWVAAFMLPMSLHANKHGDWTMTNFTNENGLPQNSVVFAQMDNDGYLWLATMAGVVRYDGQRFRLFDNTNSSLLRNRYIMLGKDSSGRIYCVDDFCNTSFYNARTGFSKPAIIDRMGTTANGEPVDLNRLDMRSFAPLEKRFPINPGSHPVVYKYHEIGKRKGFLVMNFWYAGYVSNGKVRRIDSLNIHIGTHMAIGCIDDKLCCISENRDFLLIDSNGVRSHKKIPFSLPWNQLRSYMPAVSFYQQEHHLLMNMNGDIYEVGLAGDELEFRLVISVRDIPHITCIRYYPEKGLLLIGSNTKGLFLFKKQQFVATGKNNVIPNAFYALAPYGKNQVIATVGTLQHNPSVPGAKDALNRYSILRDHNRHYWYSNAFTLIKADDQFHVLKKIPLAQWLQCVQEDDLGTIWISYGDQNFGWIQADTFHPYKLDSIEGTNIMSIIPAGNQTFWLVGKGLCMSLDVKHHQQRIYHEFDSMELRTVYLDKQGSLWLGSYGQGYFLYRNGRFVKMPEDEGHHLSVVSCFLEDRHGFIWMTTNNGLFQCAINDLYRYTDGKTKQVYHHYYGKESGLKTSEFNGGCTPSGIQLDNGRFAFPSMDGVVQFYPDSTRPMLPDGNLFIEQVLLDGVPVNEHDLSRISPSFKRLELTVSSPYFGNPNNLNIQYNIDGLDDHWYPLAENNRIVLNRLKYGNYNLRLRKKSGFGQDNFITTELPLIVTPFFYQTWWFRLTVGICIAFFIVLIIQVRYRYLIRQRNHLEAEVKDRTSALVYNNKLMEKLTVMIAHDLKSPLHFLSKITGHLRNNVQQENMQGIDRTSSEIKNTADQVYQFIEEFNLWASSFSEGFRISKTSFLLDELLQELGLFFKEMLQSNGNRLSVVTAPNYILDTDREMLKVILRNIIDNANKHARMCDISILVRPEKEQYISITITDTGEGMSEPNLKRIHDRITQASTAAGIEKNSRLGYQIIIDFATRLGAKLDVKSERGKGTSVTLSIQGTPGEARLPPGLIQQVVSAR